jgi:DNA-binding IclR family transcriptional regulator
MQKSKERLREEHSVQSDPCDWLGYAESQRRERVGVWELGSGPHVASTPEPRISRSLEYGVAILECFSGKHPVLRISELADMIGVSRSTMHRYATTLVQLGYLEQDEKRRYRLARAAARPGTTAIETIRREVRARTILEDLRAQTGHTVSLGLLSGSRVLYVYRLSAHATAGQYGADGDLRAGAQTPALHTPLGLALLSTLLESELLSLLETSDPGHPSVDLTTSAARRSLVGEVKAIKESGIVIGPNPHGSGHVIAAPVTRWMDRPILAVELTVPAGTPRFVERFSGLVKHTVKLISV